MYHFELIERQGTYSVKLDEAEKKFGTSELLPLWVADMDLASPPCVQQAIQQRAAHPLYGYTVYPEIYFDAIQRWYANHYCWSIEKEWIVPAYGVVPSLNFAIEAYTDKNDGIIIQTPLYPPFAASVRKRKRKILDNTLLYVNGTYRIDFEDFESKAKEASLFLLCSPHNPTGRAWSREELDRMISLCLQHDVLIISDEIHADIVYGQRHHVLGSIDTIMHRCAIFNAPSKTFNVAGLNTSYAIIPDKKLRVKYMQEQNRSGISNGNPFGIEALIAAYRGGENWLEQLKIHLQENIRFVTTYLQEHTLPIKVIPAEATYLMWLDCREMGLPHEALRTFFIEKARLGLNEGMSFGKAGEGFMRLNIGTSKSVLEEAMERLNKAIKG